MVRENKTIREVSTSMYERMVSKLPLPCQIPWLIFAGLLFLIFFLLARLTSGSMSYILMPIFASFIMAFIPIIMIWASKKLSAFGQVLQHIINQPESEIALWYRNQLKAIHSPVRMCVCGAIFVVTFIPSVGIASKWWQFPFSWFNSRACDIVLTFMVIVAAFMLGTALYVLLYTTILVFRLSKLDLRITIYQHPLTSIKAVGALYVKFALMAAIADAVLVFTFIASPLELTPLIASWLTTMSLVVIVYFLAPLLRIHNKMSKVKYDKIRQFSSQLEKTFLEVTTDPNSENIKRLGELLEIQQHLQRMSEWPFDANAIITLLCATIVPIIAMLIEAKDIMSGIV